MGQGGDTGTLMVADCRPILFVLLLILLLGGIQGPKFVVPLRFQGIGYQPVRRVDVQVASLRQVGFIPGSLDLLFTQTVHLLQAGLHLLLDGECDFQRQGNAPEPLITTNTARAIASSCRSLAVCPDRLHLFHPCLDRLSGEDASGGKTLSDQRTPKITLRTAEWPRRSTAVSILSNFLWW